MDSIKCELNPNKNCYKELEKLAQQLTLAEVTLAEGPGSIPSSPMAVHSHL